MKEIIQQFKNAMAIIRQMKAGEWEFDGCYKSDYKADFVCCTAKRKGVELWIGDRQSLVIVMGKPWELGAFGRLVWYGGAGKRKKAIEKKMRRKPSDLTA